MTNSRFAVSILLLASGLAIGCGQSGPTTYSLSGTVSWNGKPVPAGSIRFEPDTKAGNAGPGTVATIRDGRYATPEGKGVLGGKYRAFISGSDGVPFDNPEEDTHEPLGRPLFTDVLQEVEFPQAAATHDFVLAAE